jgi:glycosyltransferase involved in cell wall biosynthesis
MLKVFSLEDRIINKEIVRVLHLDHTTAQGGAELALLRMLLVQKSWEATLALPRPSNAGVYAPLEGNSQVSLRFGGPSQPSGASAASVLKGISFATRVAMAALSVRMSRAFRASDVVHANTSRAAIYGAIATWLVRKPLVIHLRDFVDVESMGKIGFILFTRIALRRADGVIANSRATLASAEPHLAAHVLRVVIPSASGLDPLNQWPKRQPRTEVGTVGMVARLDPWKGQDLLLRAFARVFAGTETRLAFAGGAPFGHDDFKIRLGEMARDLGVESQVTFAGHVEDVPKFIDGLDICVQASIRPEPLGQNVLQYLSAGKPVLATRQGGPGEWILHERNGLLFDINDVDSLSAGLQRLKDDARLRADLARAAADTLGLRSDSAVAFDHAAFFKTCLNVFRFRPQPEKI